MQALVVFFIMMYVATTILAIQPAYFYAIISMLLHNSPVPSIPQHTTTVDQAMSKLLGSLGCCLS